MYVGTLSDKAIIERLKKNDLENLISPKTNAQYQYMIDSGQVKDSLTHFFAKDIKGAIKTAKELQLKNFAKLSSKIYESGTDY